MQKPDKEYINSLLNLPDWNYDPEVDENEMPFTKEALKRFNEFLSNISGMPSETIQYEPNDIGGIHCKYLSHHKYDGKNAIITILMDFGDNMFSYSYIRNGKLAETGSFKPYSEILNCVPLNN